MIASLIRACIRNRGLVLLAAGLLAAVPAKAGSVIEPSFANNRDGGCDGAGCASSAENTFVI